MQDFEIIQRNMVVAILFSLILGASAFSYKDAENWGKQYPECKGKHQSPIIINSRVPYFNGTLKYTDFDKIPTKMTLNNTGHTVEIKADWSGEPPKISGGPLHANYVFEKISFHWDQKKTKNDGVGHMIYDAETKSKYWGEIEINIFLYKTDLKSFEKAQSEKDGLAVISISPRGKYLHEKILLQGLEKSLIKVQLPNSTAEIPPFRLEIFVNDPVEPYVFYEGSLDSPPCSESVTWFIQTLKPHVSKNLVEAFRKIKLAEGDVSNARPFQALNERQVMMVV